MRTFYFVTSMLLCLGCESEFSEASETIEQTVKTSEPESPAPCTSLVPGDRKVARTQTPGLSPGPAGGTVAPALYSISRYLIDGPAPKGGVGFIQQSIRVSASGTEIEMARTTTGDKVWAGKFEAEYREGTMILTGICPAEIAGRPTELDYSVVGSELWIYPEGRQKKVVNIFEPVGG